MLVMALGLHASASHAGLAALNPLTGVPEGPAATFTWWQVTGGLAWSIGITIAGYALGSTVPGIDQYPLPTVAVIPTALELRRSRREGGRHAGPPTMAEGGIGDDDRARCLGGQRGRSWGTEPAVVPGHECFRPAHAVAAHPIHLYATYGVLLFGALLVAGTGAL
jgi:hypothetical protein